MYKLYDGIIGHEHSNNEIKWRLGYDSQANFLKNIITHSDLNYFKNLTYKFNNYGHRSRNIHEINLNNYILFIGCSHTEGIGNYVEDTFPYLISERLNMDYYNLALMASGPDVQFHNLFVWLAKIKMPKLIVWQWTYEPRFSLLSSTNNFIPIGSWSKENNQLEFLVSAENVKYTNTRKKIVHEALKQLPVQVLQIDIIGNSSAIFFQKLDYGRDMHHYGPKSHAHLADCVFNYYLNKYSNNYAI